VHIVDNMSAGKEENINPKAFLHVVDIRDLDSLIPIFKDVKYVFHEAANPQVQYSMENPVETNEINVKGLLNVLEASRINNVHRVIFASSSAIYGNQETMPIVESMYANPLSPYGAQKYIGEVYMKLYSQIFGVETVCFRYFNVYGPRQSATGYYASVIPRFIEFKKKGEPLPIVGDGENKRDYVHVTDVARANLLAMTSDIVGKGETINLGVGESFSINHIAGLIGGETINIPPRIEPKEAIANISKAKELLNWEPTVKLEEGIAELKEINKI
ncbi:MAG TPA: NAD-dependent epimerase/dehydratase family protein, partial [Candidatus Paceibacterota bacterium]